VTNLSLENVIILSWFLGRGRGMLGIFGIPKEGGCQAAAPSPK